MRFVHSLGLWTIVACVWSAGCSDDPPDPRQTGGKGGQTDASGGGGATGGAPGTGGTTTIPPIDSPDAGGRVDAPCTVCHPPGGQYCGRIGAGCTETTIDCGMTCDDPRFTCGGAGTDNVCGTALDSGSCTSPTVCNQGAAGQYCGIVGNGCGGAIDCGGCPNGRTCGGAGTPGVCGVAPDAGGCPRAVCNPPGGNYCGTIGDNCGGSIVCPPCAGPLSCGGAGVANVCGAQLDSGACQHPTVCDQGKAGKLCGVVGDGCGGQIDCGGCTGGFTCGGGGTPGVCGAAPPTCTPTVCNPPGGLYCGDIGDTCGGTVHCGSCPNGQVCGARGAGVCGAPCPLCPMIPTCSEASVTTLSGRLFTGALNNPDPIYNAQVFIPNIAPGTKLPPFTDGLSCDRCTELTADEALDSTLTKADGSFVLSRNIPAGTNIPLVVQLGRWRRQITVDIQPCTNNVLPDGVVRFPRNQADGDIPLTAVSTGDVDRLECLLRKIGIEDAEFTAPTGNGRIHMYYSNGAKLAGNTATELDLKGSTAGGGQWSRYAQILFPCEGREILESTAALGNFLDYVNKGGRAFTTHYSYAWLFTNAPLSGVGTWTTGQTKFPNSPLTGDINTATAKGSDFAEWLRIVGALSNPTPPQIAINDPRPDLGALIPNAGAQLWISSQSPATTQHITIDTPIQSNRDGYCGRVVFSDFHVTNDQSTNNKTFPTECDSNPLTAQEKVLEFMLFDLASCVGRVKPEPPPSPPPPVPPPPPPPPRPR